MSATPPEPLVPFPEPVEGQAAFDQRLSPEFFDRVQSRVTERLKTAGLAAVLTDDPEDVAYLTGFFHHPCERPVAVWLQADGRCVLLLPELEREHADLQQARAEFAVFGEYPGIRPPFAALADAVGPLPAATPVGFGSQISHARLTTAQEAIGPAGWRPTTVITEARYLKFDEEIALHQEAARITDLMITGGVALITAAISADGELPSEAEIAAHISKIGTGIMYAEHRNVVVVEMLAGGLVYAAANSAFPHGPPSSYRLRPGDTFMLSLGCAVGGRYVEGERTFVLGEPTAEQRTYHSIIERAQRIGGEAIRPGTECREANRTCLEVIRDAGFDDLLRHRQGHGIGLGMHEPPWLEDGDPTVLQPGMIVSNEPGIYLRGHAGYRISDSMLVTEEGSRPLTSYPRDLASCTVPV